MAHLAQARRSGIPIGNAVSGGIFEIEVRRGTGRLQEQGLDLLTSSQWFQFSVRPGRQEFQLLGVPAENPGQAARPGRKGRIALLGVGATETPVIQIEYPLVGDPSANIIGIAPLPVKYHVAAVVRACWITRSNSEVFTSFSPIRA